MRKQTHCIMLLIIASLYSSGCVYALMGAEHNYTAANNLEKGMTFDQALEVLSKGGNIEIMYDSSSACTAEGNNVESIALGESEKSPGAEDPNNSTALDCRTVFVSRVWGFMGYGQFTLYFDADNRLRDYHLKHYN